jgi:hypothetical protein
MQLHAIGYGPIDLNKGAAHKYLGCITLTHTNTYKNRTGCGVSGLVYRLLILVLTRDIGV